MTPDRLRVRLRISIRVRRVTLMGGVVRSIRFAMIPGRSGIGRVFTS